ncbi:MAG: AzlD domain-containing protein [Ilumatobacteraceae bacterium]
MMPRVWIVILGLFAGVYLLKAAGPLVLGRRALPGWLTAASNLLPAALLAALVATSTFASGRHLQLDARAVGLVAAAVALWRKQSFVVVVIAAALATAATRALA